MPQYPVDTRGNEDIDELESNRVGVVTAKDARILPRTPQYRPDLAKKYYNSRAVNQADGASGQMLTSLALSQPLSERQTSEQWVDLSGTLPTSSETEAVDSDSSRTRGSGIPLPPSSLVPCQSPSSTAEPSPPLVLPTIGDFSTQNSRAAVNDLPPLQIPHLDPSPFFDEDDEDSKSESIDRFALQEEHDRRWILNLSMHFRDRSNREKFFVTYAEKPNLWRRITISMDYRNPPPDSLEADLSTLHYQRDKSMRIYEALRESLDGIAFCDTVTNLKLESSREDGLLHVFVQEDQKEIINFPSIALFDHISCPRFHENALNFDSHLSGFVYKVRLNGQMFIKKEIPGPDTADEFLYEVNALDSLHGSSNVIQLEGLVTDDHGTLVKGLLISNAPQGSLVDMLYDFQGSHELPWHRREKWAKQIVNGLSEIHEAGFVQGDFTLSNIVIDDDDNAQIIDINRRGCPVGWEPPELIRLIKSGQRIGMCIGVKTDIFQLGMVLWALAEEVDEPERAERPFRPVNNSIPVYFRTIVETCLSTNPRQRLSAKELLRLFPDSAGVPSVSILPKIDFLPGPNVPNLSTIHRSGKQYIDPDMAVTIDDVQDRRRSSEYPPLSAMEQVTYLNPDSNTASSMYRFDSSGSWVVGRRSRGRSPVSSRRRRSSPFGPAVSSATSVSEISPTRHFDELHASQREPGKAQLPGLGSLLSQPRHSTEQDVEQAGESGSQAQLLDKRISAMHDQGRYLAHLLHKDSGFDEMMAELDLDSSHVTEKPNDDYARKRDEPDRLIAE